MSGAAISNYPFPHTKWSLSPLRPFVLPAASHAASGPVTRYRRGSEEGLRVRPPPPTHHATSPSFPPQLIAAAMMVARPSSHRGTSLPENCSSSTRLSTCSRGVASLAEVVQRPVCPCCAVWLSRLAYSSIVGGSNEMTCETGHRSFPSVRRRRRSRRGRSPRPTRARRGAPPSPTAWGARARGRRLRSPHPAGSRAPCHSGGAGRPPRWNGRSSAAAAALLRRGGEERRERRLLAALVHKLDVLPRERRHRRGEVRMAR